ncbi:MAG: hypothetical protein WDO15_23605 [Bacteroidota bacterium]
MVELISGVTKVSLVSPRSAPPLGTEYQRYWPSVPPRAVNVSSTLLSQDDAPIVVGGVGPAPVRASVASSDVLSAALVADAIAR